MRTLALEPRPRVAFLGDRQHQLHVPDSTEALESAFFRRDSFAFEDVHAHRPELCFIFGHEMLTAAVLRKLPGRKLAVLLEAPSPAARQAMQSLLGAPGDVEGLAGWTCSEQPPPSMLGGLPFAQVLPPPVAARFRAQAPRLAVRKVLLFEGALPPPEVVAALRLAGPLEIASRSEERMSLQARLADYGTFVYWSSEPLARHDPLPLLAMAQGVLVVANQSFVQGFGIEEEDEFVMRESPQGLIAAVSEARTFPTQVAPVRVRAWQRVGETFLAESVFSKLVHDLRLFSAPRRLEEQLRGQGCSQSSDARASASGRGSGSRHNASE